MASLIIPAHNEESVIAETVHVLMPLVHSGEIELIVVCNGCTDKTATVVASFGKRVKCIETSVASKTHALNLGDEVASGFPRIYLDADVILSPESVRALVGELLQERYLAVSSTMQMDFSGSSWAVKSFYCIWQQLSYVQEGMIGTGVYALSEKGRKRFTTFPDVIADDGYIRAIFLAKERGTASDCYSIVRSPATLADLVKIKTRSRLGRYELIKKFPELASSEEKKYGSAFFSLLIKGNNWPKIPIYFFVNIVSRMKAKSYHKRHGYKGWERDMSTRKKAEKGEAAKEE